MMQTLLTLCGTLAPYCGVLCFLAPLPTILQVARDKSTGALPLLPYSSMIANSFVWVMYGLLKYLPSVYLSNAVGVILGMYYFRTYTKYCTMMGSAKQIRMHFREQLVLSWAIYVWHKCWRKMLQQILLGRRESFTV